MTQILIAGFFSQEIILVSDSLTKNTNKILQINKTYKKLFFRFKVHLDYRLDY